MLKKCQTSCIVWAIIFVGIFVLFVECSAQAPDVVLIANPNKTEIIAGEDKRIALIADASGSNPKFEWTIEGAGKLDGSSSSPTIVYIPPEQISGGSASATVSVRVSTDQGEVTRSMGFTIIQPEKTELETILDPKSEVFRSIVKQVKEELQLEINEKLRTIPPIGSILFLAADPDDPPDGYLFCDGRALNRTEYDPLFKAIGTVWGDGNKMSTFNIPDLRGVFPRFLDTRSIADLDAIDPGRKLGEFQIDSTRIPESVMTNYTGEHSHIAADGFDRLLRQDGEYTTDETNPSLNEPNLLRSEPMRRAGSHTHTLTGGDSETRPKNQALVGFIQYK